MPSIKDIGKAYENYQTHVTEKIYKKANFIKRTFNQIKKAYLSNKYGYYKNDVTIWTKWLALFIYFYPRMKSDLDAGVMYLNYLKNGKVLDVGCGSGKRLKYLQDLGWDTTGTDVDKEAVKNEQNKGLNIETGNLEDLNLPSNYFDAITLNHVLEHIPNPSVLINECYRLLKHGGKIIIVVPNNLSWGHKLYKENWRGIEPPRHLWVFNRNLLLSLLEKNNINKTISIKSIHGANHFFLESKILKNTDDVNLNKFYKFLLKQWSRIMQLLEWLLLRFNKDLGEELIIIVTK